MKFFYTFLRSGNKREIVFGTEGPDRSKARPKGRSPAKKSRAEKKLTAKPIGLMLIVVLTLHSLFDLSLIDLVYDVVIQATIAKLAIHLNEYKLL